MTPKQHADAINKATTQSEWNDAIRNAGNDGYSVKAERTEGISTTTTVQVGHTNNNGEFVPEHGQAVRTEPTDLHGSHVERTTDVVYEDGQVVGVSDRQTGELQRNPETGELTRIEGPEPEPLPEPPAPEESPKTETPPPTDSKKLPESPPSSEDAPPETKEKPKDEDPSKTGQDTDCDATCQAQEFGIGVLEGLIPTTLEGAALMALGFGLAIVAPWAAVGLGVALLGVGGFQLWDQWGRLSTAGRARGVGQMVGSILPTLIGLGVRQVKGVGKGKGPPKADPPETPPADSPGTPDAPPKDSPDSIGSEKPQNKPSETDSPPKQSEEPPPLTKRESELASDPAKNGKTTPGSISEAKYILEAERAGVVKGPVTRSKDAKSDFVDADNKKIDVKYTDKNSSRGFKADKQIKKLQKDIDNGEKVLVDTRNLSPDQVQVLRDAKTQKGWTDEQIVFFP